MKKAIIATIALTIFVCFGSAIWLLAIYPNSPSKLSDTKEVTIERGSSGAIIARKLEKAGVINHPFIFRLLAKYKGVGSYFQAGEYLFKSGITPQQVMQKMRDGEIILRKVTIPEGKTSAEIVEIINNAPELSGSIDKMPKEGTLLPNTYRYIKDETRASIIERMQKAQHELIDKIWPERAKGLPLKTKKQAIILASIVEKETGVPDERTHVAGLYINRLHKGMLLQADPTVSYGLHGGQSGQRALTYKDLKRPNPYNTYMNIGLPPSPICNPGKESIAAVLNPDETDNLYMVATGTGGHYFAKTNKQHLLNVKKYRAWQKQHRHKK